MIPWHCDQLLKGLSRLINLKGLGIASSPKAGSQREKNECEKILALSTSSALNQELYAFVNLFLSCPVLRATGSITAAGLGRGSVLEYKQLPLCLTRRAFAAFIELKTHGQSRNSAIPLEPETPLPLPVSQPFLLWISSSWLQAKAHWVAPCCL